MKNKFKYKKINRRNILKYMASVGAVYIFGGYKRLLADTNILSDKVTFKNTFRPDKLLLKERISARRRVRRIIMNNDGNDISVSATGVVTPQQFLDKRTSALANTEVDSIFYCDGVNNVYSHASNLTESLANNERTINTIRSLKAQGTDALTVMINFCKQNNKEIFWSMRMNDNHDATRPQLLSKFKKDHPQYLVGKHGVSMPMMPNKWSAFDYGVEPVRKRVVDTFADVISRYDVDGVEMDFFRHPAFFRAQFYGKPVTQKDCDKMTQIVREVRKICDAEALKRGHSILIAVRLPDSLGFCKSIGLDMDQWLQEGLIDIITGCGYFKLEPWEYLVALGKQYNVPVYACLEQRRIIGSKQPEARTQLKQWRGEAYMAWKGGVNGIYTFNRFNPHDEIFREIGNEKQLSKLDMIKQVSYVSGPGYLDPSYWLKGGSRFLKK